MLYTFASIQEAIKNHLKERKIEDVIVKQTENSFQIKIFMFSLESTISSYMENNNITLLFSIVNTSTDYRLYTYKVNYCIKSNNCTDCDTNIEVLIDEFLKEIKSEIKALNKSRIALKIKQIKELCEEAELNLETFITINYEFEE